MMEISNDDEDGISDSYVVDRLALILAGINVGEVGERFCVLCYVQMLNLDGDCFCFFIFFL